VDSIGILVGYPNLAAVRPEESGHYRWSFNRVVNRIGWEQGSDVSDGSIPVNPKDIAFIARDDHVKAKCANMVECDPVVVRSETAGKGCKHRSNA
jgi:hypothetical protein